MTGSIQNVFIALNRPLTETGIVTLLSETKQYNITPNLNTRELVFQRVREQKPQLLIVDYAYPEFLSLNDLQSILQQAEHLNVLIISSDNNKEAIHHCVQLGIKGYITNECGKNEFIAAVESTARGDKFFCSKILNILLDVRPPRESARDSTNLTIREKEMLRFLAKGYSTQRIADTLYLSPHTVQTHRKSIIKKLKIKSSTEFVIHALDLGLITQRPIV